MKIATIGQHENGIFYGEIRDEFGDVESATTKATAQEVHIWAAEHGADELKLDLKGGFNCEIQSRSENLLQGRHG